jgi:2-C-methyl-D-erythritol 4-phosphate cytidylyltransferase
METPQVFQTTLIRQAYQQILRDTLSVTDEVSAATHAGIPVQLVENPSPNLKITLPGDLATAAALLP